MTFSSPLSADEEMVWRALLRVVISLPRALDDDLVRATGLSLTEYTALMSLSEAPDRQLRMTDLANTTALSASRMSRLVDSLRTRGLVDKRRCSEDGRGHIATLTPAGLARLQSAYLDHLVSARRRVVDQIDPAFTAQAASLLAEIAERLSTCTPPCS